MPLHSPLGRLAEKCPPTPGQWGGRWAGCGAKEHILLSIGLVKLMLGKSSDSYLSTWGLILETRFGTFFEAADSLSESELSSSMMSFPLPLLFRAGEGCSPSASADAALFLVREDSLSSSSSCPTPSCAEGAWESPDLLSRWTRELRPSLASFLGLFFFFSFYKAPR